MRIGCPHFNQYLFLHIAPNIGFTTGIDASFFGECSTRINRAISRIYRRIGSGNNVLYREFNDLKTRDNICFLHVI